MPDSEPKLWSTVLVDRLAELRPDVYAGFTADQLTRRAQAARHQAPGRCGAPTPTPASGANRKGITRAHILEAITKRDRDERRPAGRLYATIGR